jgi:peptidyl-prolyl cis-trans isomerase B (cyclophilin B)
MADRGRRWYLGCRAAAVVFVVLASHGIRPAALAQQPPLQAPVIVVETSKGTFSFETFPQDAPSTVSHVEALVRGGFYDGIRVHRAVPGFVVQFGDPQSRDAGKRERWGRGRGAGSGTPVGVAEISPKRLHRKGAVGMAHMGDPARAESQIYVTLDDRRDLNGRYAIFGQVVGGEAVPARLTVGDTIIRMYVRTSLSAEEPAPDSDR